jgi:hypothetical protein
MRRLEVLGIIVIRWLTAARPVQVAESDGCSQLV